MFERLGPACPDLDEGFGDWDLPAGPAELDDCFGDWDLPGLTLTNVSEIGTCLPACPEKHSSKLAHSAWFLTKIGKKNRSLREAGLF